MTMRQNGDDELPSAIQSPLISTEIQRPVTGMWLVIVTKVTFALVGLFLFILALQLLKDGTRVYGNTIKDVLNINSAANTLGFGWLLAYVFLSGSPVAAIAISFFAAGSLTALQTFTMITGSRLGASFIVLFVGFIYSLRGHQRAASVAIGVLALLTTAAIYLPALAIGTWLLTSGIIGTVQVGHVSEAPSLIGAIYDPILGAIKQLGLPGWAVILAGIATLLTGFSLLDRALPEMNGERSAFKQIGRMVYRPMAMFLLGAAITSVTLSVSVSLSILVPLSVKGFVRRENTLPYIMGANITTFIDTLIAALLVGGPSAFTIVLVEMLSVAVLSLLVLLFCYRPFASAIMRLQEQIIKTRLSLSIFLGTMLFIPLVLLLVQ